MAAFHSLRGLSYDLPMVCNAMVWSFNAVTSIDWLDVIKTLASLATLGIAYFALRNWQRQDRAKREAEFLDALIEAVHTYIVQMARPITLVRMSRIGMMSHLSLFDERDEAAKVAEGAIPYIKKDGEGDARRLTEALNEVRPGAIKLRSLGAKGQVFGFSDYAKCQQAVALLVWQFDRIEAFTNIIGWPTMNWENPEIQRTLQKVLTVSDDDIQKHIAENNIAVLDYARQTYARIYGAARKSTRRPKRRGLAA